MIRYQNKHINGNNWINTDRLNWWIISRPYSFAERGEFQSDWIERVCSGGFLVDSSFLPGWVLSGEENPLLLILFLLRRIVDWRAISRLIALFCLSTQANRRNGCGGRFTDIMTMEVGEGRRLLLTLCGVSLFICAWWLHYIFHQILTDVTIQCKCTLHTIRLSKKGRKKGIWSHG